MKREFIEFQKLLRHNGYTCDRCNGSHYIYKKDGDIISVNKDLNKMVARRLIKEHKLKEYK